MPRKHGPARLRQIPNQTLLHFFGAHALKYGIAMRGGVNDCAEWLGVQAIPGKWSLALEEDEVTQLRRDGKLGGHDIERAFCFASVALRRGALIG